MKIIQRYSVYVLLLAVAVSVSSCRRAVEKARRNIRFEGIEKVERQGLTGAEVVVRVMNDTGYKALCSMRRRRAFTMPGSRVGTIVLREAVEVPRRTTDSFRTLWRLKISDPLALYVLALEGTVGRPCRRSRCRMPWKGAWRPGSRENFARADAFVGFFEYLWPYDRGR